MRRTSLDVTKNAPLRLNATAVTAAVCGRTSTSAPSVNGQVAIVPSALPVITALPSGEKRIAAAWHGKSSASCGWAALGCPSLCGRVPDACAPAPCGRYQVVVAGTERDRGNGAAAAGHKDVLVLRRYEILGDLKKLQASILLRRPRAFRYPH